MSYSFGSRRPLLAIPFLLVLFLLTLVSACSDADDPVTPPPPATDREITGTLGAAGPGHVAWLGDPGNLLMVSCNTTGNVAVVDPDMK